MVSGKRIFYLLARTYEKNNTKCYSFPKGETMSAFMSKPFRQWAASEGISNDDLRGALTEIVDR